MKKVLFTLLAIAITLASCKNYDDEFDQLSDDIAALRAQQQIDITALQTQLGALTTFNTNLADDIEEIKTTVDLSATQLADLTTFLEEMKAEIEAAKLLYATERADALQRYIDLLNGQNDINMFVEAIKAAQDGLLMEIEAIKAQIKIAAATLGVTDVATATQLLNELKDRLLTAEQQLQDLHNLVNAMTMTP